MALPQAAQAIAPAMQAATNIFTDNLCKCQQISSAMPHLLVNNAFSQLRTLDWYSNKKYQTLWFTEEPCNCIYAYIGSAIPPTPMPDCIISPKNAITDITGAVGSNSCNANLYQDGSNSISWHSDNENRFLADRVQNLLDQVQIQWSGNSHFVIAW